MQNHSLQLVSLFRYWVFFFLSYVYCDSCIAILKSFFFSQFVHWTVSSFLLNNEVPTFTSEKSELLAGTLSPFLPGKSEVQKQPADVSKDKTCYAEPSPGGTREEMASPRRGGPARPH